MQRAAILHSLKTRLHPMRWGMVALFVALIAVARILLGEVPSSREIPHLLRGFLLVLGMVALAPVPWQWTGNARRMALGPRGVFQAVVWDIAWLALLLYFFGPGRPLHSMPFGPGRDPAAMALIHHLHQQTGIPLLFVPLLGFLPIFFVGGWIIAKLQAAEGDRTEALEARQAMEQAARQAQDQALRAQLDPHVLYNALGGISELIREEPARAEEAVVSLAELYRKLTVLGRQERVRLGDERALLQDYLAVEAVRLGTRLRVAWDWPEALDAREIPPLLVQPLVENAVKHGLAPRKEGGALRIAAEPYEEGLRIIVANDGLPLELDRKEGIGLANLRSRLALMGRGTRLELRQDGGWTTAELLLWPGGSA